MPIYDRAADRNSGSSAIRSSDGRREYRSMTPISSGRRGSSSPAFETRGIGGVTTQDGFRDSGRRGPASVGRSSDPFARDRGLRLLEQSPSRLDWYRRNNYPPRAFGVGHGYNDGFGYRGPGYRGGYYRRGGVCFDSPRGFSAYVRLGISSYRCRPYYGYSRLGCFNRGVVAYQPYYYGWPAFPAFYSYASPVYYNDYYTTVVESSPAYVERVVDNYYTDDSYYSDGTSYSTPYGLGTTSAPVTDATNRELGERAYFDGNYDAARQHFVRALLDEPDNPEVMIMYAYCHFATGDYQVAAMAIRRAFESDATLIESPIDLYRLYGTPHTLAEHISRLDQYAAEHPDDVQPLFLSGYVRYASGDPQEAARILSTAANQSNDVVIQIMRDAAIRAAEAVFRNQLEQEPQKPQPPKQQPARPESRPSGPLEIEMKPTPF